MKKSVFLFTLLLSLSFSSLAQKVTFGPMVSGLYNWASYNDDEWETKPVGGFSAGLFARAKLLKFYIQPELLYSSRGSDFQKQDALTGQFDIQKFRYQTIDLNLMFGFQLFAFAHDAAGFRLHTGPGTFFMINDSFKINEDDITASEATFKNNILNWQFGVGVDFTHRLMFDLRYEHGLSNIVKDSPSDARIVPNAFMVQLAYKLIKKK
jgi:hypothetical protein